MWKLAPGFLSREPLNVAVIGVGGTGSELVSHLTRLDRALRVKGYGGLHVVAFDPDTVSPANIVRQRYSDADLGRNKAVTLIHRINMACNTGWQAVPERFLAAYARQSWDIVISCVDNRKARAQMHKWAFGKGLYTWRLWMDLGNTAVTAQVIIGTPRSETARLSNHLPTATELHPELIDTSIVDDDTPSCSAIEALERQDLFVNSKIALEGAQLLWALFKNGGLNYHGRYINVETGSESSLPVPARVTQTHASERGHKRGAGAAAGGRATRRRAARAAEYEEAA